MAAPLEKHRTMQDIVYGAIKERVLNADYKPGQRLMTADLASEFGMSRMPVREALQRLEAATGLVTLIPHRGAVVNGISVTDLREIFEMRAVLEGLAAQLAMPNMTPELLAQMKETNARIEQCNIEDDEEIFVSLNYEFHRPIWDSCNAPRLNSILNTLYEASRGYRYKSIKLPGRLTDVVKEHQEIIDAFERKDVEGIERTVRGHYRHTLNSLQTGMDHLHSNTQR
ncbi:MAG: GntR family transcriptional regulator [Paracoccaceae bacterium]